MAEAAKLYDEDFYQWTRNQADALRRLAGERWNGPLDLEHLAEEVEDLGKSQLLTVRSQVERVLEHLLKLEYSPAADPRRGWLLSVLNARGHIRDHMTAAIRNEIEPAITAVYARARRRTMVSLKEHGELDLADLLPKQCPYTFAQVLDEDWFPANQHGLVDRFT
ncbi:MAG: DUF29 domain-containing protein [Geminicoccaceae bacterium]